MIGPILVAVSWLALRLEGLSLRHLGFDRPRTRLLQFAAGFGVCALVVAAQQFGLAWAMGTTWTVSADATPALIAEHLRFTTNSVLYEELLFRGYLLFMAARWLGARRAVWLSAAVFGVYHWFTFGALGNPFAMAFVLAYTGAFGLLMATAFVRTGSLALPIGLHFGWNVAANVIFSIGPLGTALLVPVSGELPLQAPGVAGLLLSIGLPLALVVGGVWVLRQRPVALTLPPLPWRRKAVAA